MQHVLIEALLKSVYTARMFAAFCSFSSAKVVRKPDISIPVDRLTRNYQDEKIRHRAGFFPQQNRQLNVDTSELKTKQHYEHAFETLHRLTQTTFYHRSE